MKTYRFYKPLLYKAYFDRGLGLTNYVKYLIAFFGIASSDVRTTMYIAVAYAMICFILGKLWYKYKLIETEYEVQNNVNPFVREMRGSVVTNRKI